MIILKLIGLALVAYGVYVFMIFVNKHTLQRYSYMFFNAKNFTITAIGYTGIFVGNH